MAAVQSGKSVLSHALTVPTMSWAEKDPMHLLILSGD